MIKRHLFTWLSIALLSMFCVVFSGQSFSDALKGATTTFESDSIITNLEGYGELVIDMDQEVITLSADPPGSILAGTLKINCHDCHKVTKLHRADVAFKVPWPRFKRHIG